ncbi:MAG: DnaA regulatory inactivator Hda [Aestuariibacter sp.]
MTQEQLVFPFPKNEHFTFDNFLAGSNQEPVNYLTALSNGEFSGSQQINLLVGATGMGKSHLLTATFTESLKHDVSSLYLSMSDALALGPDVLKETGHVTLLCLDDIEQLAAQREWEIALFDLINRVLEQGHCYLLMSARQLPKDIGYGLPDLVSRLQWGQCMQLKDLSEQDKVAFLMRKAAERGFDLPKEVARFLLLRLPRDLRSLQEILEKLDKLSLQSQRKLTIPFVKEIFDNIPTGSN